MEQFYYQKQSQQSFAVIEMAVRESLKQRGFNVITEIDLQKTLKDKLGVEMSQYKILGACNARFAHQAIMAEPEIGVLLPCNVVIRRKDGLTVISVVMPTVHMRYIDDSAAKSMAQEAEQLLKFAIDDATR
jgi:uncharacterized protein (DUF302 family)